MPGRSVDSGTGQPAGSERSQIQRPALAGRPVPIAGAVHVTEVPEPVREPPPGALQPKTRAGPSTSIASTESVTVSPGATDTEETDIDWIAGGWLPVPLVGLEPLTVTTT